MPPAIFSRLRAAAALTLCLAPLAGAAQTTTDQALLLTEVLERSASYYPSIVESLSKREQAAGRLTQTEGAFDLVFAAEGFAYMGGFYNGRALTSSVTQPLGTMGAKLYSKYDLSAGDLPVYSDEYFTNKGGRLKVGIVFSLLRDRAIDERRAARMDARLAVQNAELELLMTRIGVQRNALAAYAYWYAAGRQVRAYEHLLELALDRDKAIAAEVQRGARARIDLTENARNITHRRVFLLSARAELDKAANALSLYYRDTDGQPAIVAIERLPSADLPVSDRAPGVDATTLPDVIRRHPALRSLSVATARAQQKLALARNSLAPRVDLSFELGQGIGGIGQGGRSRDSTDPLVGLTVSVPLQRRAARGAVAEQQATLAELSASQQLLAETLTAELGKLVIELQAATGLESLAGIELGQTQALVEAENKRFTNGASDFFLINVREEAAANAEIELIKARLRRVLAQGELNAATLNLGELGLQNPVPRGTQYN
ncbi:MAG: TolC family protein [Pseudomonadales bacterium]